MGETQAGMFTERLIAALDPGIILSMGIAGGLNDLLAGDGPRAVAGRAVHPGRQGGSGSEGRV
jgi:nucleoside phosphorylase